MEKTERKITFMGTTITINPIKSRTILEKRAMAGEITPLAYWQGLRAHWAYMTQEEKEREFDHNRREKTMTVPRMGIIDTGSPDVQRLLQDVHINGISIDRREYVQGQANEVDKGTVLYGYVLGEDGAYTQDPEEELCCIVQEGTMWIAKSPTVTRCLPFGMCLGDLDNRDENGYYTYAPRPEDGNGTG